jgi:hypothetical protein
MVRILISVASLTKSGEECVGPGSWGELGLKIKGNNWIVRDGSSNHSLRKFKLVSKVNVIG